MPSEVKLPIRPGDRFWVPPKGPTGIEAMVCADIAERQRVGLQKYGVSVADNPLTREQWLQHAYEEALDMAIYLKRALMEEGA